MIFIFLSLCQSFGFSRVHLRKNEPVKYDIAGFAFYFSVRYHNLKDFTFELTNGNETNSFSDIKSHEYYLVKADSVTFTSKSQDLEIYILQIESNSCGNITFSLGLQTYISISTAYYQTTDPICLFFYQPGYVYRVIAECNGDNPTTKCEVEQFDADNGDSVSCRANSTCSISVTDGFLVTGYPKGEYINISTRVINIKGEGLSDECRYKQVHSYSILGPDYYNVSVENVTYSCEIRPLQIGLAITLVAIMFFTIISGLLMYYFCRPNRSAYDVPKEDKRKSRNNGEYARRHNSFNEKSAVNQVLL